MTLEEAKEFMWLENNKNPSVIKWQHHKTIRDLVEKLINQIFSDHEAQIKAKESDLERQDMIIKCLNIDLDSKEKLLKAKDEEMKELGEIVQQYLIQSKNYDAIIKAKDDEIRRLNNLYADTIKDLGDALIEIERLKEIINTSIEEIEYAIIKPQYALVYLNNAIRFLKENK